MKEFIKMSHEAAQGISLALSQDFTIFEKPERMAWTVILLKYINDNATFFPKGKWATIQNIELQMHNIANRYLTKEENANENNAKNE